MQDLNGITSEEARQKQAEFGKNELITNKKHGFIRKVFGIVSEPMFVMLLIAATIYFILGEPSDGAILLVFVLGIIGIEVFQEWKTDKTLKALKDLSAPQIKVIRDGKEKIILSCDLVPNDLMFISEGIKTPADGFVIKANDLCVDESSLTGEAEGVYKCEKSEGIETNDYFKKDYVYGGTLVTQGSGYIKIEKIGLNTEYGKIGKGALEADKKHSPLQKQTGKLVKICAGIAAVLFALVGVITYFNIKDHAVGDRIIESILSGIVLAMAMIPEEFPVVLTIFLSMGAWRLAKKNTVIREMSAIETLGAVSVLCVDKTGTITKNQMTVSEVVNIDTDEKRLIKIMGMACETTAYDPMEKAMLEYCEKHGFSKEILFAGKLVAEYSFTNELKMMGHVWQTETEIVICVKGSPEKVLELCNLSDTRRMEIEKQIAALSKKGLRVIAVGEAVVNSTNEIPSSVLDCHLRLGGFIGLFDPPRETVKDDIKQCTRAGIRVIMITGDNGITASNIAKQVGIPDCDSIITGDQLEAMSDSELEESVKTVSIFSRVLPNHKMRIVKAFQANGEIVAMTGDGVNDAPALKHADIGIAMGKRGSDVSREAADMVLTDDNFSTIVSTVKDGRRIYQNIKKSIGYVFTIHIPVMLAALLAPLLGIMPANLMLLPLQIMLLELIIDPTCSIVLERQPPERNIMEQKPRNPKEGLLSKRLMVKAIIQGLIVFAAAFGCYYFMKPNTEGNAEAARTMAIVILMFANLFLVLVISSEKDSILTTIKRLSKDKVMWITNLATIIVILIIVYSPLNSFLSLAPLSVSQFSIAVGLAAASVLWYELVKLFLKRKNT